MSEPNLVFPSSLRTKADNGDAFMSFTLEQENSPDNGKSVSLYLPTALTIGDSVNYNTFDEALISGAAAVREGNGISSEAGTAVGLNLAAKSGSSVASAFASSEALKNKAAINPKTAVAFESTGIRTFDFQFNMIPESSEESDVINKIENFFRKFMYPDATSEAAISIRYPPLFKIEFYVNGEISKYLPKIETCYLTSLQTVFNSTSNAFHKSGAPVETAITVSFQESKALIRNDLYGEDNNQEGEA